MDAHQILQLVFYILAGLVFIVLLGYLFFTKKKKFREKISIILILILSFAQSFIYILMTAINAGGHSENN